MRNLTSILCLTIAVLLGSAGSVFAKGKWFALENQPNCSVWNYHADTTESANWSGSCLKGKAHGKGKLILRFKEKDKEKEEEEVYEGQYTYTHSCGFNYVGKFKN